VIPVTDWVRWHQAYDDPDSWLTRRLTAVRRRFAEGLFELGPERNILSLCAGDGRDVLPVLRDRPEKPRKVVLVEKDPRLVQAASEQAEAFGLNSVQVIEGDAGEVASFAEHLPVDVLLLCGIFGNISEADIEATVASVPSLLSANGLVIWTRGRFEDVDLRPLIRQWFTDSGMRERSFDGEPEPFGVGVAQMTGSIVSDRPVPARLFTFLC
jgi:ubiquinone/menaquinone biosynthesis C-methylase UbiE